MKSESVNYLQRFSKPTPNSLNLIVTLKTWSPSYYSIAAKSVLDPISSHLHSSAKICNCTDKTGSHKITRETHSEVDNRMHIALLCAQITGSKKTLPSFKRNKMNQTRIITFTWIMPKISLSPEMEIASYFTPKKLAAFLIRFALLD